MRVGAGLPLTPPLVQELDGLPRFFALKSWETPNTSLAISEARSVIAVQAAFFSSSRTSGASLSLVSPKRLPSEP